MSPDEFGFEPFDDDLGRRLRAVAPPIGDADATLEALRPRLRDARRRRRATMLGGSGAAAAAVLAIVVAITAGSGGTGSRVGITPASGRRNTTTTAPEPRFTPPPTSPVPQPKNKGGTGVSPAPAPQPGGGGGQPGGGPAPDTRTYTSAGGSITVRFANGDLSLLSTQPAAGFTSQTNDSGPTRVEVRFVNDPTEWQIRVDVVDGQLSVEITQEGGGSGDS